MICFTFLEALGLFTPLLRKNIALHVSVPYLNS